MVLKDEATFQASDEAIVEVAHSSSDEAGDDEDVDD